MLLDRKSLGAGASFIALALFFGISALTRLPLGSPARMGPGLFPLSVAVVLLVIGLAIVIQGVIKNTPEPIGNVNWLAIGPVLTAPILFGITIRPLGLVPALLLTIGLAFFAGRDGNWKIAVAVTLGLTAGCALVFRYALNMPVSLFGTMIGG